MKTNVHSKLPTSSLLARIWSLEGKLTHPSVMF
jgi:hypothetical protein